MRLTPLTRAVGLKLARDLPPTGPNKIPLLRRGALITPGFQRALAEQRLHMAYQPKVRLRDGSLTRVEALVRWEHPTRGLLAPGGAFVLDNSTTTFYATATDASGINSQCSSTSVSYTEEAANTARPISNSSTSHWKERNSRPTDT